FPRTAPSRSRPERGAILSPSRAHARAGGHRREDFRRGVDRGRTIEALMACPRRSSGALLASRLLAVPSMSRHRVSLGKTGEDLACRELERRGYAILERRYGQRRGELDIIARDGRTIVFVEVKTRHGRAFGAAIEA